jgi:hypothetical protein
MGKQLKILAKNGIIGHEKFNSNVPGLSSADPASKAPFSPAETCRKNGTAEAKVL